MPHTCKGAKVFVFAGEHSGDLHGSHLIDALAKHDPELSFEGVCGPRMRALGVSGPLPMEAFEVMGLTDVLLALPKLYKQFHLILAYLLENKPQAVILIDYPGFNLRLAKALRHRGYQGKLVQYVSPSVWAWGKQRIEAMADTLDLALLIYPFESAHFLNTSLKTVYVGSPIQEYIRNYTYDNTWRDQLGIEQTCDLIALFPGSRRAEITRNLPALLNAAHRLHQIRPALKFALSCSNEMVKELIDEHLKHLPPSFQQAIAQVPKHYTYELMKDSRTAIAKSGTVTLELALHRRPTLVIYKLTRLNRFYAKYILQVKLPFYCIVNILANAEVFPEFIEKNLNDQDLFHQLHQLNEDESERNRCFEACDRLQKNLGEHLASNVAAQSILDELSC